MNLMIQIFNRQVEHETDMVERAHRAVKNHPRPNYLRALPGFDVRGYNKLYYQENREKILEKRRAKRKTRTQSF